ncbi:MAG: hypothetical protein ABJ215_00795 [Alphaproteobacteria bacterium]
MVSRNNRWQVGAALGAALLLSACENPWREYLPDFDGVLSAGWLEDEAPLPVVPVYCYDTIGAADCYEAPLEGAGNRLRGFEGPPPNMMDDR